MRKINFSNNEYCHIYNRGVDKRDVFLDENDYLRFLDNLKTFNNNSTHDQRIYIRNKSLKSATESATELSSEASELSSVTPNLNAFLEAMPKLVEIICYCLNPNHFHLIIRQLVDSGIEKFMHKLGTGYTNFFNLEHRRSGALFQGPFKAVEIKSFEHLVWLSVYVNKNAQIHSITDNAADYPWCSYPYYLGIKDDNLCNREIILNEVKDYKSIADETALFMKKKKDMERYLIE
ncbi:MAG: hypothetical protein NT116_02790 [Candidatus Parcubacteria bacterium]|nr:hypothetical protein [Candidatus Parcubacteria bacterium]